MKAGWSRKEELSEIEDLEDLTPSLSFSLELPLKSSSPKSTFQRPALRWFFESSIIWELFSLEEKSASEKREEVEKESREDEEPDSSWSWLCSSAGSKPSGWSSTLVLSTLALWVGIGTERGVVGGSWWVWGWWGWVERVDGTEKERNVRMDSNLWSSPLLLLN